MRITKIEPQKKNPRRKNLYADGEFVLGVSDETLLRAGLRTGDEITAERINNLLQEEDASGAKRVALHFLATRPRTRKEIRDKLRGEEYGEKEITQTIEDLTRAGLLNDAEFAGMYIRDALSARPTGKNLLKRKLLLLGIEKEIIEAALAEAFSTVNDKESALEAGRKFMHKSTATRKTDTRQLRHRLVSFLGRRGFAWDTIEPVVRELIKEQNE